MTLDEMIRLAEKQARIILMGTKEELVPMWLLLTGKGTIDIVGTPWHGDQEKYLAVERMREMMRERQCIAYSVLVEAWFSVISVEESKKDFVRPSERPDRRESVVAMAANHWGQHRYKQFEIIRDKKGRCRELQRLDMPEDKMTSDLFDNLLQTKGRPN